MRHSSYAFGSVFLLLSLGTCAVIKIRSLPSSEAEAVDIPSQLQSIYSQIGQARFKAVWKEFNALPSEDQDRFLMSGLTNEEYMQLVSDFDQFSETLTQDENLLRLFMDFEQSLNLEAFNELDRQLLLVKNSKDWWDGIKTFLLVKLHILSELPLPLGGSYRTESS